MIYRGNNVGARCGVPVRIIIIMNKKRYYFDYAATTPVDQRVVVAMEPYWFKKYGNPSGLYFEGRLAKQVLDECRQKVAQLINADSDEVIFTSGGSESNNLAITGVLAAVNNQGKIIVSAIEHKSILNVAKYWQQRGVTVEFCPVLSSGLVDEKKLAGMIDKKTILVSIIYANNEIGVVQDISRIGRIIKKHNPKTYFHTDACQAMNYLDIDVKKLGVDLLTFNGSKIYGPKGVGGLYAKKGVRMEPLIMGGGQERGWRAGTENIPLIVGMTEAMVIARRICGAEAKRVVWLRDKIISRVLKDIPDVVLNGDKNKRLANNVNISVAGAEGESLLLYLDEAGIAVSTGSACSASDLDPSHVLLAIGQDKALAHGSLRITLGRWSGEAGVDYLLSVLPKIVERVRQMSAVNN